LIDCQTNELDSLPALPASLLTLNCDNNLLITLPVLPTTLVSLSCNINHLTALPGLPASLSSLECYENQISSLPVLPASLQSLTCSSNHLTGLPILPGALQTLKCYADSLYALPALPSSLTYLDCNNNTFATLPSLPVSLSFLNCSSDHLPTLPTLPGSLITLLCGGNNCTSLPTLPGFLQTLDCGSNPLTGLPGLPNSLVELRCESDGLTLLPTLSTSLIILDCNSNSLDSLPTLPVSLNRLDCENNHLTALPTLPSVLDSLDCYNNQLTNLPAIPSSLTGLNCENNLISCFSSFPNTIHHLFISGNPFTCLANYIPSMDSITLTYPLCVYGDLSHNPHNCASAEGLVGYTFTDMNSNCTKDSADFNMINIPMKVYDASGTLLSQTYTASNGVYNFSESAGTYTALVDTTGLPFIPQCSAPGIDSTITTTLTTPLITDVNFDFNCKPGFDIGVQSVYHDGLAFPGETQTLRILAGDMTQWYNMHCASGISGNVEVKVTGPVYYSGIAAGALTPVVTGHIYTYSIADFGAINNKTAFGLHFTTDTTAAAGSLISVSVVVTPLGGDNDTTNNIYNFTYPVTNSHDPNFKETTPTLVSPTYNDYFTYTIHFQNSGSAPAINIRVADTLDSNLDPSTFQLMNYSHTNVTTITGNILNVSFPNIMLSDSSSSADSSKGFVQYRVKALSHRTLGTRIYNTGFIYFDYNPAVITNTTVNTYENILGINESNTPLSAGVYPNPSNGIFTLKLEGEKNATIEVYNVIGEMVWSAKTQNESTLIDLTDQPRGVYVLKVIGSKQSFNQRIIKQ
jgi:uncharacterized repeat protein (TIGR01451 family)